MTARLTICLGLCFILASVFSGAARAQDVLGYRANPHGDRPGAPERTGFVPPPETIVQLGVGPVVPYAATAPVLNLAHMRTPWVLKRGGERLNEVTYRNDKGSRIGGRFDQRAIPANAYGLPDFGTADLAAVKTGEVELFAQILADTGRDPDWRRWLSGRYEVVAEYEAGRSIGLHVHALGKPTERTGRLRLDDGFVRETWTVDGTDGLHAIYVSAGSGADARQWRRLSIYQTHAYDRRAGGRLRPTNARALHEAGAIWSPRYLDLFASRYNAIRLMDLGHANLSDQVTTQDRNRLGDQSTWALRLTSLQYKQRPWDEVRHLRGDYRGGVPIRAQMRLPFEASLRARAAGADGHVLNPQILMPFRLTGPAVDDWLDEVADEVRAAAAGGVRYDYVKIGLYNEPWNTHPGAFREAHLHAARAPASFYEYTNEAARGYTTTNRDGIEPWYANAANLAKWGTDPAAGQKGAARRLIHLISRAYARHPDVNWIGEHSGFTAGGAHSVGLVFEGARDGAADVERWSREGDPYTGSTAYAVVPRDEDGRYAVGGLFTYSLTTYWYLTGGPDGSWLGGLAPDEVARLHTEGTLNRTLADRFLTRPASPDRSRQRYGALSSLAGMRQRYAEIAKAAAAEGGVLLDFYEGSDHTTAHPKWSEAVKAAHRDFLRSAEHAEVQDAIHDAVLGLGFVGIADYGFAGADNHGDKPLGFAPWTEELDPYTAEPWEALWAKRLGPLPPPE